MDVRHCYSRRFCAAGERGSCCGASRDLAQTLSAAREKCEAAGEPDAALMSCGSDAFVHPELAVLGTALGVVGSS
jgi:hypothetical protein